MKQPESELKTKLKEQAKKLGWYARRVEDQFAVGILDMIFVMPGGPTFFAEVKIVKSCKFGASDRQFIEMARIEKCAPLDPPQYAYAILVGYDPDIDTFYIMGPTKGDVDTRNLPSTRKVAVGKGFFKTLREYYDAIR